MTADVIIQLYLSLDQVDKAINILMSINWDTYGAMSLLSLHKIATHIFKLSATLDRTNQLQRALGSFHTPAKKLCFETENEFGDNVDDITRRFFHYLIRYEMEIYFSGNFFKNNEYFVDINYLRKHFVWQST